MLQRAIDESGPLSSTVRSFIDSTLQLKVEVPALYVKDDGSVVGGVVDSGIDCLGVPGKQNANYTDVQSGPDSTPTLSFTSGI
jgi:L-2-aminoadipate reductase